MSKTYHRAKRYSELEALRHLPGVCSCQKLRSASRAVTRIYDEHLRPTGLTIGQYSVLAALYYVPSMPVLKLATRLELDRTTLTRSLALLEREAFVSIASDSKDTRVRSVSITDTGLRKLIESYPLWVKAEEQLSKALGDTRLKEFRKSLDQAIEAMKAHG